MNAGRILRYARLRAGLSQRALAEASGVAQPAIARIERGVVTPRVDTLERLLAATDSSLELSHRLGDGVDRTLIRASLGRTAEERVTAAGLAGSHLTAFLEAARHAKRTEFEPEAVIRLLGRHGVRYVLIGGLAAVTHGAPLVTQDIDVCCARDQPNLELLAAAMREVHAEVRGAAPDLPFRLHAPNLASRERLSFTTDVGWIDIMATPAGTAGYDDLARTAEVFTLFGHRVLVASVEDLIRMKQEAGRPKDLLAAEELGALRDEIDAGSGA